MRWPGDYGSSSWRNFFLPAEILEDADTSSSPMLLADLESQPGSNPALPAAQPSCRMTPLPEDLSQVRDFFLCLVRKSKLKPGKTNFPVSLLWLVHLKWHIQLRSCSQDSCVQWKWLCFLWQILKISLLQSSDLLFYLSALPHSFSGLTGSSPIQGSLGHSHVLGAQSFKCRLTSWICGWGIDSRDLASWVVTHWLSISAASFVLVGAGLERQWGWWTSEHFKLEEHPIDLCFKHRQLILCYFISMCCYLEMMVYLLTKFR